MKWQLVFRGVSVKGDIHKKILRKLEPLSKYMGKVSGDMRGGVVNLSKGTRWGYKVKLKVRVPGKEVSVTGKGKELLSALDEAYAKSARRIRKHYERLGSKKSRSRKKGE